MRIRLRIDEETPLNTYFTLLVEGQQDPVRHHQMPSVVCPVGDPRIGDRHAAEIARAEDPVRAVVFHAVDQPRGGEQVWQHLLLSLKSLVEPQVSHEDRIAVADQHVGRSAFGHGKPVASVRGFERFVVRCILGELGRVLIRVGILALLVTVVIYLALPDTNTERIRDIMIIIMALEFMFLGVALLVLIVQLATLINLLQNEIIPIVESTNETANTLRGTTIFLSENLTEPVIKLNEYLAGITRLAALIGLTRRR